MTKKSNLIRRVVFALFILYVLLMLFVLVIPNNYRSHNVLTGGLTWERWLAYATGGFNIVPFRGISEQIVFIFAGQDVARNIIYLVGNIIGFAPLGFFLPAIFVKQSKFTTFLIAVLLALIGLELVQLMTMRGSFDIDDIILNTVGACLGFWVMNKFARCIRKPTVAE